MFVYSPVLPKDLLRRLAVKELVDCLFNGSEEELLLFLRSPAPAPPPVESQDGDLDTSLL
jgi:hypothetical protein